VGFSEFFAQRDASHLLHCINDLLQTVCGWNVEIKLDDDLVSILGR